MNYVLKLLAKGNMKVDLYLGTVVGMHRVLVELWSLNISAPDKYRGIVTSGGLSTQDFVRYKIVRDQVPYVSTLNNCIDKALPLMTSRGSVFDRFSYGVDGVKSKDADRENIQHALRVVRLIVSKAKYSSTHQSPTSYVTNWVQYFIGQMSQQDEEVNPAITNLTTSAVPWEGANA